MSEYLTITNAVEHAFCPKFTYYELVLKLKQYEEKRGTVLAGREFHNRHASTNKNYIPKGIEGGKTIELQMFSKIHSFVGKVDTVIETPTEIIIIERKYSDHVEVGPTLKTQLGLMAILIEENLNKKVNKAIIVFDRAKRLEVTFEITSDVRQFALSVLEATREVITTGVAPPSFFDRRCVNCCYRKVCPVGSLKVNL